MNRRSIFHVALVVFLLPGFGTAAADNLRPRIAIIIDDLGYERAAGERAISLPGNLSFAVLPDAPHALALATLAHERGKDVLLHLPMQATIDSPQAGPGSLVLDMTRQQFSMALAERIDALPHIIGINTHRGSLLTRHPGHMRWLMEDIRARGDLVFVDSYTTAQSVALRIANEIGVPATRRDVFLDPDVRPDTIAREFARLEKLARERGSAVAIGHPYRSTLDFLEKALPSLEARGIDLVSVGRLISAASH